MRKIFYCTKDYMESLGVKNVVELDSAPVTLINNMPTLAKTWKFKNEEELTSSDLINDLISTNGLLVLYKMDTEAYGRLNNELDGIKDEHKIIFINLPKEADEIFLRMYTTNEYANEYTNEKPPIL